MALEKEEILEIVEKVIDTEFERRSRIICDPMYFSNQFLKYAMETHTTLQCIIRTHLEMMKASIRFTKNNQILKSQIEQTITYLSMYVDENAQRYVSDTLMDLRYSTNTEFPYLLVMQGNNRFKSFRSFLAKFRTTKMTIDSINYILNNLDSISEFESFSKEELNNAKSILRQKLTLYSLKSPLKDLVGCRYVIDEYNYSADESDLIPFIYDYSDYIQVYCSDRGFEIMKTKNYIKYPKPITNYQSFHIIILIGIILVEFQLRTRAMHIHAEHGDSNHDEIYKNTLIQNFLKEFMYNISKDLNKVDTHKGMGLLESFSLPNQSICWTPDSEVPQTYEQLAEFADLNLIKKLVEDSPTFDDIKR